MSWKTAEEHLATRLPGYEPRPEQQKLALGIEEALADEAVLQAQGGCGVGKSFAALIPLIEYALDTETTSVVATATKALQTQYHRVDVPFLQENLGRDFVATTLKGRGSYVCQAKLSEVKVGDVSNLAELRAELTAADHSGDLDDIVTPLTGRDRAQITTSSEECPGKSSCPFGQQCFAEFAKQRAAEADLVIVNHALLATDLKLKQEGAPGILGEYKAVVVDEGHELENYVTNTLGAELTQRGIENLGAEAFNLIGEPVSARVSTLKSTTEKLFAEIGNMLGRERTTPIREAQLLRLEQQLLPFLQSLSALKSSVTAYKVHGDDKGEIRRKRLEKKTGSALVKFTEIVQADSSELVRWAERDDKRGVVVKYAPLHVGPFLREMLWADHPAVLMSATLAVGNDFSFIAERLGMDTYRTVDAGTPFNFAEQARLLVPSGCDPSDVGAWRAQVVAMSGELIRAAGGRTLMLFSATSAMKAAHSALKDSLENQGLTVLMQGEDTVRALAEKFKSDETSVLFGLKSFATGFDVQGDALRLVIIDKMPFPVPTDVIFKARADAIDAKKTGWNDGSFMKLSVPSMALDLLQGFGRLIRTKRDQGAVVILDSRLNTKGYGKKIMGALPPASRLNTLRETEAYLASLNQA